MNVMRKPRANTSELRERAYDKMWLLVIVAFTLFVCGMGGMW